MDTLTRIRAFIDVVDAQGFSAAARKQGRSKALLSKYVRELEDEVGALLLNRTTRQFSLTDAGRTYYASASAILKEIDDLADLVRETNSDLKGRLKISVPRTFADAEAGQALIDFVIQNPEVRLEISAEDRFVDLVEEGFDLAIRITRLQDSGLIAKKLADFSVIICATPAFVEKYGPIETPEDLARVPCLIDTNSRNRANWPFRDKDGNSYSVNVKGPLEINSPPSTLRAALSGLGVALLPDFVAASSLEKGELVPLLQDYMLSESGIYAIYPHRRYLPAKVRALVDFLTNWFKKCD
ncbi:LysR family transcriptional regulator [Rhizobium sp. L1K21]|uniref:LysR family transcriptional regulator n=1 Tax=Rhizobium sp. L1K21 TaxID=2954933 RepID=UPI002093D9CB|nr:LysR family transcriptional regulator [Rhizobium sp. L1K21]MCO6186884.1 LysR family transcriptional regulator [Rhizobium sp. L1K21]